MAVDETSMFETHKMKYDADSRGYSFSKWLAYLYIPFINIARIGVQVAWGRLRKALKKGDIRSEEIPFEFRFEERAWYLAAAEETISKELLNQRVKEHICENLSKRNSSDFYIWDFINSLHLVFSHFCPWARRPVSVVHINLIASGESCGLLLH